MSRKTNVLTISLPQKFTRVVDDLAQAMDQTRSELIRNALRDYVLDMEDDKARFLEAYKETRGEKTITLEELKKKYDLA